MLNTTSFDHHLIIGILCTWATCHAQVTGFPNCCYKIFSTKAEAVASFLEFRGCEDEKVFMKPPSQVVNKTPLLVVVGMVSNCL